jgi:hypothetical protein
MKRFIGALLLVVAGLSAACNPSTTTDPSAPGASEDAPASVEASVAPSVEETSPSPSP